MTTSDPGPTVRNLVALLLRVGLGMTLLSAGLTGYVAVQRGTLWGGGPPFARPPILPGSPLEYLPYVQVAIGLALVLGFFTTAAAVAAGLLFLFSTLSLMVLVALGGGPINPNMNMALMLLVHQATTAAHLMLCAAVLWFSPVASNPWSLDRLIFARREEAPEAAGPRPTAEEPAQGSNHKG